MVDIEEMVRDHMVGKSEKTIRIYSYWLLRFDNWLTKNGGNLYHFNHNHVQQFLDRLIETKKSASTVNMAATIIRQWANWTAQEQAVANLRIPSRPAIFELESKSLSREQKNKLLEAVKRDGNIRNIAIVYLFLFCGLQVSELQGLDRQDVILSERGGQLLVRAGKGAKTRVIPLATEVRVHLQDYLRLRKDQNPALFISNSGKRISVRQIERIIGKYGINPLALRHTFCRTLVSTGMPLETVASLMGHDDLNSTRRYAKPRFEELMEAAEKVFSN